MAPEDLRILGIQVPREVSLDEIVFVLGDEIEYDDHRGLKFRDRRSRARKEALPTAKPGRRRCPIKTKNGYTCGTVPEFGKAACHIHDPNGKFALQNPKYRKRMIAELAALGIGA